MADAQLSGSVRTVGLTFGGMVAAVAGIASFTHMQKLAAQHGEAWLSWITPLSVDGLLVLASITLIQARRRGETPPKLATVGIVVGLLVSLAANVGAAGPDLVSKAWAMWPPIAFALAYELLLNLARQEVKPAARRVKTPKPDKTAKTAPVAAVPPSPAAAGVPSEVPELPAAEADARVDVAPAVGTSLHIVPGGGETLPVAGAPEWLTDDLCGQPREAMKAYLDRHPNATGAELDRFGAQYLDTKPTLGRKVRAEWLKSQPNKASGE